MAETYPWLVLAPLAGLTADFASHVLTSRLMRGRHPYQAMLAGVVTGLLVMAALSVWALASMNAGWGDALALLVFNGLTYLALAYGYFNFVNLNLTSLRIRILQELLEVEQGLTVEAILRQYGADDLIDSRLTRLTRGGQIIQKGSRYYGRLSALLVVARVIDFLKFAVLGRRRPPLAGADSASSRTAMPPSQRPVAPVLQGDKSS
jgi:hypothetical protein